MAAFIPTIFGYGFWFVALLLRILQIPRGYDSLWPQGGALVHKDAEHNSNN